MAAVSSYPRAYVLPALLVVALFYLVPNVSNFFLAFTELQNTRRSDVSFVGLDNFWRLGGTDLLHPLWVTIGSPSSRSWRRTSSR